VKLFNVKDAAEILAISPWTIRFYIREGKLRPIHHAITELAESRASERTIMSIAGHISPRMLEHYSHIRLEAKRNALEALAKKRTVRGYDTKNDTNSDSEAVRELQVTHERPET
jgi:predicted site-specific integrase-resolvase